MKSSQQNRRIGILCLIISGVVFCLTVLSDAKAETYLNTSTQVAVVNHGQVETVMSVSPWFIYCRQVASRFFTVSATALAMGLLLVERAKMIRRLDALEGEVVAMRSFVPR